MIAAGEVVEKPANMIKELLENSIDAKSTKIIINVKQNNRYVKITDNGIGMSKEDLLMCVERHATSKISTKEDLFNIMTYGFRGEALSSIGAVSKLKISSKDKESEIGTTLSVSGGKITNIQEIAKGIGTEIEVKDLFFNTPARLKFLRKATTEYMNIKDIVIQEALGNADVAITLILDDKVSIKTTGNGLDNAVVEIFGNNVLKNCKKFSMGYLGNGSLYRSTKDSIFTFVNGRMVKSKLIENAVIDGYYTKLMKGRYPFAIIFLEIDPQEVDVNVHPSKKIVKFSDEKFIYEKILKEIENSFERDDNFVSPTLEEKQEDNFLDFAEFSKFVPLKAENKQFEDIKVEKYEKKEINDKPIERKVENKLKEEISRTLEIPAKVPIEDKKRIELEISDSENNFNWLEEEKEKKKVENIKIEKPISINENIKEKKLEKEENNFQKKNKKIDFKVLGQIFNSFILVERDGILEIYDQHIVHERILYESLKEEYSNREVSSQQLLVPIRVLVDPRERELIFENIDSFTKFGFEIDEFGDNEILIRAVPIMNFRDSIENIFREILRNLKEDKSKDIRENIIISMSCRGAVKANEKLTQDEMEIMVEKLHEIGEYTCPHGRPIIIKITMSDLEKLFKRK